MESLTAAIKQKVYKGAIKSIRRHHSYNKRIQWNVTCHILPPIPHTFAQCPTY